MFTGYFNECSSFFSKPKNKIMTWPYKHFFGCDSKAVLYLLICINYGFFYIGQTEELKKRTRKRKSVASHPNNSNFNKNVLNTKELAQKRKSYISNLTHFCVKEINTFEILKKGYIMN